MSVSKMYYSLAKKENTATLNIYGDITSFPWMEGDVSSYNLSRQLEELNDIDEIHVFINSYGGEVAEGLAIYNALKRHKARVKTCVDGFACSIASVIFMAGDERTMNDASLLMIHNAWTFAEGNANDLRKQADDLDKITQASINAYKAHSNLSEEEIKELLDNETWLLPSEAVAYGFATAVEDSHTETKNAAQSARKQLVSIVMEHRAGKAEEAEEDEDTEDTDTEEVDDLETEETSDEDPTADDESEDTEEETDGEEETEDEEEPTEKTAQKWSGFFNALIKK